MWTIGGERGFEAMRRAEGREPTRVYFQRTFQLFQLGNSPDTVWYGTRYGTVYTTCIFEYCAERVPWYRYMYQQYSNTVKHH